MRVVFLFFSIQGVSSCSKGDYDFRLCFIGDSMIANWDVQRFFPNRIVVNLGKDGAGLDYLSSIPLTFPRAYIIVLIGTNDITPTMDKEMLFHYASRFSAMMTQISGKKIILISLLPTASIEKNELIQMFNGLIRSSIDQEGNVLFVDCYEHFVRQGVIRDELYRDGLHLNEYGYLVLADLIKDCL